MILKVQRAHDTSGDLVTQVPIQKVWGGAWGSVCISVVLPVVADASGPQTTLHRRAFIRAGGGDGNRKDSCLQPHNRLIWPVSQAVTAKPLCVGLGISVL